MKEIIGKGKRQQLTLINVHLVKMKTCLNNILLIVKLHSIQL